MLQLPFYFIYAKNIYLKLNDVKVKEESNVKCQMSNRFTGLENLSDNVHVCMA
jgi:hypothetical protein